jgi:hypothetical protein
MRTLIIGLALGLALAAPGYAQVQRLMPANAKHGAVTGEPRAYPLVEINKKVLRLAPGGVIVDQNNRFILHGALPPSANVMYVLDPRGEVSRIVILTAEEQTRLEQAGKR